MGQNNSSNEKKSPHKIQTGAVRVSQAVPRATVNPRDLPEWYLRQESIVRSTTSTTTASASTTFNPYNPNQRTSPLRPSTSQTGASPSPLASTSGGSLNHNIENITQGNTRGVPSSTSLITSRCPDQIIAAPTNNSGGSPKRQPTDLNKQTSLSPSIHSYNSNMTNAPQNKGVKYPSGSASSASRSTENTHPFGGNVTQRNTREVPSSTPSLTSRSPDKITPVQVTNSGGPGKLHQVDSYKPSPSKVYYNSNLNVNIKPAKYGHSDPVSSAVSDNLNQNQKRPHTRKQYSNQEPGYYGLEQASLSQVSEHQHPNIRRNKFQQNQRTNYHNYNPSNNQDQVPSTNPMDNSELLRNLQRRARTPSNNNWRRNDRTLSEDGSASNSGVSPGHYGERRGGYNQRYNRGRGRNYNNQGTRDGQQNRFEDYDQSNHQNNRRGGGFFGFKRLEELLTKQPEEALMIFVTNIEKVQNYCNGNEITPDVIVLMFEVIAYVIKSTFAQNVAQLLLAITRGVFFNPAKSYIMQLPLADSATKNKGRRFWNAPDQFFINVALTLNAMIEVIPSTALDIVPEMLKAILYTLPNLAEQHRMPLTDEVYTVYEDLQLKITQIIDKEEQKKKRKETGTTYEEEEEPPPNDFHDIDVYPTALEITTRTPAYLRKNIIKGAYRDVHHYLDVQYRLLREDFVAPLRDGICEYFDMIRDGRKEKLSNIKIYKEVLCLGVVPNVNQVGYLVQVFKPGSIKNLEHTKRFMFGSLVCLTPDNFTTIIFGKIIDRDMKYMKDGRLVLGFDVGVELNINRMYILVECTIYFEPYYQVLTALKKMDENRFPFKEYLVDVRTQAELPGYRDVGYDVEDFNVRGPFRLRAMSDSGSDSDDDLRRAFRREIDEDVVEIDYTNALQEIRENLNPSQLAAYRAAMMSKFCIIQGPPGTGKTYLALKVAHSLLMQGSHWKKAPMLVICYTNHALDQFLEGILPQTRNIVRVGGQSKNEKLQEFNLRKLRVKAVPGQYFDAQRMAKAQVEIVSRELSHCGTILKAIHEYASILKFGAFNDYNVDPQFARSWFSKASNKDCLNWLLYQPKNRNDVKFADYELLTQMIGDMKIQETQEAGANDEDTGKNDDEDNPHNNNRVRNQLDLDVDEDLRVKYESTNDDLFNVRKVHGDMEQLGNNLKAMAASGLENTLDYLNAMHKMIKLRIDYDYVCDQLRMIMRNQQDVEIDVDYDNPNYMPANDRWLLYGRWLRNYKNVVIERYVELDAKYRQQYTQFTEVKDMLDLYKMKHVDVIGMTTTGAARLHKTLQALACPIVIVEEAAEVLEAHIITALSPSCQHLILIGDHKQLKPSTADYKITKDYNLGVSLFERMVENGLHCYTLDVQHRMRPEIASLVCPVIYPVLHNHETVELYPNVRGIDRPLFFLTHEYREKESQDRSKENQFEAEYLILLARYLVLNNYDASRITIIAAYSGQWFVLLRLKKKYHILREMRICILDNYQGEENDIILLSLVRNNEDNKIGFLGLENRICVALSRARHGMYVMGNMPQLCASSQIWRKISEVFERYDSLGTYLTVRCVNHPDTVTHLSVPKDFEKVPEGGCLKICEKPLACGHTCAKLCHSTSHEDYRCYQPCRKVLCDFGHYCPDKCYQECGKCKVPKFSTLPCGHSKNIPCHQAPEEVRCDEKVPTVLPCGHHADKPCHDDAATYRCPHPCEARVEPCGHACAKLCHIRNDPNHERYNCLKQCIKSNKGCSMEEEFKHPCQKLCYQQCDDCIVEIQKARSCGHFYDLPCHSKVEDVECKKPCKRTLPLCGHNCKNKCNAPCGPCNVKVQKVIFECGHSIQWECGKDPRKTDCKNKKCTNLLTCGHPCPLACNKACITAKCMVLVPSEIASPCGHVLNVPCHMRMQTVVTNDLLAYCTAKCNTILECEHLCPGTCGECAQGRFHAACAEKCDRTLICGHGCITPCAQNCQPCTLPCQYRCEHSKCTKKCGVPCTSCAQPCNRICVHQRCTKFCGEICDVTPCEEPCFKKLPCGHQCIGFCGDVCPPLCRICDTDKVTEIFFGTEDDEDARFVYLPDCKHTMEASGLENWFNSSDGEIKVPRCPLCKSNVQVPRYRDYIKLAQKDVMAVKSKFFGHPKDLQNLRIAFKEEIKETKKIYGESVFNPMITFLEDKMKITGKRMERQDNSKSNFMSLRARLDLLKELAKIYKTVDPSLRGRVRSTETKQMVDNYLTFLIKKLISDQISINEQQIKEFQMEIMRFNRINQLANVLTINSSAITFAEYKICFPMIFTFLKYDSHQDARVREALQKLITVANSGLAISDVERKQILSATGLSPGHWFKCPNGHIYAIGECGGAMELAKCPECGAIIGGQNHALTRGNRLAPEMDGARAPAYPTINNIDLYDLH